MLSEFDGWEGVETIRIAASPEQVWSLVSVIARHPDLAGSREVRAIRMTGPAVVGATFEADITTWEPGSFMTRNVVTDATQPARLAWVSYPVLDAGRSEDS